MRCGGGSRVEGLEWWNGGGLRMGRRVWDMRDRRGGHSWSFSALGSRDSGLDHSLVWGCPVHCKVGFFFFSSHYRVLSNILGLYPLDTPDAHSPKLRY